MSQYPATIRRCQHIKANGTQCGSPALREEKCCYFHMQWRRQSRDINMNFHVRGTISLPTLEDANSIQVGLAELMRLLVTNQIDHRTASLLLRALRTASANLKHTSFEPDPTHVVIDPESVERRPLGATAWSTLEGREYDEVKKDEAKLEQADLKKDEKKDEMSKEAQEFVADSQRLSDGVARDPDFLDKPAANQGVPPHAVETAPQAPLQPEKKLL
jgi:hypothetical protein